MEKRWCDDNTLLREETIKDRHKRFSRKDIIGRSIYRIAVPYNNDKNKWYFLEDELSYDEKKWFISKLAAEEGWEWYKENPGTVEELWDDVEIRYQRDPSRKIYLIEDIFTGSAPKFSSLKNKKIIKELDWYTPEEEWDKFYEQYPILDIVKTKDGKEWTLHKDPKTSFRPYFAMPSKDVSKSPYVLKKNSYVSQVLRIWGNSGTLSDLKLDLEHADYR